MFSSLFFSAHVTVTDGLVNVLEGGVSRATRPVFPSHLGLYLVAVLDANGKPDVEVKIRLVDADEPTTVITELFAVAELQQTPGDDYDPRTMSNPLVVDLTNAVIPKPGTYRVETFADGEPSLSIYLQVVPTPSNVAVPA